MDTKEPIIRKLNNLAEFNKKNPLFLYIYSIKANQCYSLLGRLSLFKTRKLNPDIWLILSILTYQL